MGPTVYITAENIQAVWAYVETFEIESIPMIFYLTIFDLTYKTINSLSVHNILGLLSIIVI